MEGAARQQLTRQPEEEEEQYCPLPGWAKKLGSGPEEKLPSEWGDQGSASRVPGQGPWLPEPLEWFCGRALPREGVFWHLPAYPQAGAAA